MNTQANLQQHAIDAAKNQNWAVAAQLNQQILMLNSADLGALNRLGLAQVQLGDVKSAKQTFQHVLEVDKSNSIAKKHLDRLKNNQGVTAATFSHVYFIEEPGKTKIIDLHRLAGKNVVSGLNLGQLCELKPKNRFVSIESQGVYIGALPEDLSFRLCKLIELGNRYECYIHSITTNSCTVFIREVYRSPKNQHMHSFPLVKTSLAAINDVDDDFLLEENIPVQFHDPDSETEEVSPARTFETNDDNEPDRDRDRDRDR